MHRLVPPGGHYAGLLQSSLRASPAMDLLPIVSQFVSAAPGIDYRAGSRLDLLATVAVGLQLPMRLYGIEPCRRARPKLCRSRQKTARPDNGKPGPTNHLS